jgi:hypothetical protein
MALSSSLRPSQLVELPTRHRTSITWIHVWTDHPYQARTQVSLASYYPNLRSRAMHIKYCSTLWHSCHSPAPCMVMGASAIHTQQTVHDSMPWHHWAGITRVYSCLAPERDVTSWWCHQPRTWPQGGVKPVEVLHVGVTLARLLPASMINT